MSDSGQAETPMADHVARFWELIATEHVRILVDIRRDHDEGQPPHWDSASFPDDVAKAIAADRHMAREALQEILDTKMGRGDGVVADYVSDVRGIAREALDVNDDSEAQLEAVRREMGK